MIMKIVIIIVIIIILYNWIEFSLYLRKKISWELKWGISHQIFYYWLLLQLFAIDLQYSPQYLFVLSIIFPKWFNFVYFLSRDFWEFSSIFSIYITFTGSYEAKYTIIFQICKESSILSFKTSILYYMVLKCVKSKICFFQCFVY